MSGTIMGAIIGVLLGSIFNTIVLYLVGKVLKMGIEIDSFFTAFVAAVLCAIVGVAIGHFFHGSLGVAGSTVVHIVINAIVLLVVGAILPGMKTNGIIGALIAAVVMGLVSWLLAFAVQAIAS